MNESKPSNAQRIEDLLVDWELARAEGRDLSADELCSESPELKLQVAKQIAVLKQFSWAGDPDEMIAEDFVDTVHSANDPTALPDSNVTVKEFVKAISESGVLSDSGLTQLHELVPADTQQLARELAERLIEQQLVTNYQARVILERGDSPLLLDRYVILDSIGAGGMGIVFKALQRSLERVVAVKVLPRHATDSPEKVARFQREMKAAAQISHPNVVQAYDAHESNGVYFFAMEYVPGHDLATLVSDNGPLPVGEAMDVIAQAATGLASAHEKGIVHRDVKPSNILLSDQGVAKVLDLGLARTMDIGGSTHGNLTRDGIAMGTVAFMSPEQAFDAKEANERSDIYSLGCTLYYLLHGRPPFDAENGVQVVVAHRETPPGKVSEGRDDVPDRLDDLFQRMVAKSPEQRPQSMVEVCEVLRQISTEPEVATKSGSDMRFGNAVSASQNGSGNDDRTRNSDRSQSVVNWWPAVLAVSVVGLALFAMALFALPKLLKLGEGSISSPTATVDTQRELARRLLQSDDVSLMVSMLGGEVQVDYPDELDSLDASFEVTGVVVYPIGESVDLNRFDEIANLRSVTIVSSDVSPRRLDRLVAMEKFAALDDLYLDGFEITDELMKQIVGNRQFATLDFTSCKLPLGSLGSITELPALVGLILTGSNISDKDLSYLASAKNLEWLDLGNTLVTEDGLKHLEGMSKLESLTLTGLEISRNVGVFESLPKLTTLYLDATELHDDAMPLLTKLPLELLDVSQTKLTSSGLQQIRKMETLQTLWLRGLPVQESITSLVSLPNLVDLNLALTDLTNDGLNELRKIKSLQLLCVESTNVTESELDRFDLRSPNCALYEEVDTSDLE